MAYTLEAFCEDTRAALAAGDGDGAREIVRGNLGRLLANRDFVAAHCGPEAERGIHRLHEDPELGFMVLAHIYENGVESPPHDHGPSWAIYGQAVEHTEMTVWRETGEAPGGEAPIVEPAERYRLDPGMVGVFHPSDIHSIKFPDGARFVRVTGTDLDRVVQRRFDLRENTVDGTKPVPDPVDA